MKKISIITLYYNNNNYGGALQSYALCKIIDNGLYDVKQISYNITSTNSMKLQKLFCCDCKQTFNRAKKYLYRKCKIIICQLLFGKYNKEIDRRNHAIGNFAHNFIPHSNEIYNAQTIASCIDDYDIFITGSDQVWNPEWYYDAYFLSFVPSNKIKLSYAASISQNELTHEQLAIFKNSLKDYTAISVREDNAVDLIQDVSPVRVEVTLDPTLLLSQSEWDEICTERIIGDNYVFCYFLGDDTNERRVAEQFSEKHGIKIVTFPHLLGRFRKCDKSFGDYKLYDISPAQFLSLIKYAEYVFTDSFHATVFSSIFQKQYFTFERIEFKSMGSRIYSLCNMLESDERFCDTAPKATLEYIEALDDIDYTKPLSKLESMKEKSMDFLLSNLSKCRESNT
jgi:Polysaccharide pyruvyl transferase.